MTPAQMLEYIEGAQQATDYGEAARLLAKHMLLFARAHLQPGQLLETPSEDDYEIAYDDRNFDVRWAERKVRRVGFSTLWKTKDPKGYRAAMDVCEPTGFQFGWAYNAVRYCAELPPTGNPAIVEV